MLINTFDLTGKARHAIYRDSGLRDVESLERHDLLDLLIIPRAGCTNRRPYLQHPDAPNLEDLWDEAAQSYSTKRCRSLGRILKELAAYADCGQAEAADSVKHLEDYFSALHAEQRGTASQDFNIITVPDSYGPRTQEFILKKCGFPRAKTRLLWRSVAAILGAEKELILRGAKNGDKVAVLDYQDGHTDVSILEIEKQDGQIIPIRQAYRRGMKHERNFDCYPDHGLCSISAAENRVCFDTNTNKRRCVAWNTERKEWEYRMEIPQKMVPQSFVDRRVQFYIVCQSQDFISFPYGTYVSSSPYIHDYRNGFILMGAAKFACRTLNGCATYFDECEALSIVAQDKDTQDIIADELIPYSARCKGGEQIRGAEYLKASILPNQDYAEFYLLLGDKSQRYIRLKKLKHEFPLTKQEQPLRLIPSIIPGQGLAVVDVFGEPLLKDSIRLELLQLEDSTETLDSLNRKVGRSYPSDVPGVIADSRMWTKVEDKVLRWLDGKCHADGDWFAQSRKLNPFAKRGKKSELQRFAEKYSLSEFEQAYVKINVFGTYKGCEKPDNLDSAVYQRIIRKLKKESDKRIDLIDSQVMRLIAWSYQGDNPEFDGVKQKVLKYLSSQNSGGQ